MFPLSTPPKNTKLPTLYKLVIYIYINIVSLLVARDLFPFNIILPSTSQTYLEYIFFTQTRFPILLSSLSIIIYIFSSFTFPLFFFFCLKCPQIWQINFSATKKNYHKHQCRSKIVPKMIHLLHTHRILEFSLFMFIIIFPWLNIVFHLNKDLNFPFFYFQLFSKFQ